MSDAPRCPWRFGAAHAVSTDWPPGPRAGWGGWGLLAELSRDPLAVLARWRAEYGDVVHLRVWPLHQVVISDPALLHEVLVKQHEALTRWPRGMQVFGQLYGHSVFIAEGQAWRDKRRALAAGFSRQAAQDAAPAMAEAAGQVLAGWPSAHPAWRADQALATLTLEVMARLLFSLELGEAAPTAAQAVRTVLAASHAELFWPASWPDWLPHKRGKRQARQWLDGLLQRQLHARLALAEAAWPDDLLSRWLRLHRADPGAWPLRAVRDECMTALLAGHETTGATLAWWMWALARQPEIQAEVSAEACRILRGRAPTVADAPALTALRRSLEETLRLHPAAPLLSTRRAIRPITVGPWRLPAGTLLLLPVQLAQHDPQAFAQPEDFCPARFAGHEASTHPHWLPFGLGPRVCLGQHQAMMELTVLAALLAQGFSWRAAAGQPAPQPLLQVSCRPDALWLDIRRRVG